MSNETAFLSVIVPVYNVSAHLRACLDSILTQKLSRPIELLLIDDGSTDGSGAICDEYAARDGRIRVLHRENGGASAARNAGIRTAQGEYLLFVDGDDSICAGSLDLIVRQTAAEEACDVTFLRGDTVSAGGAVRPWSYRYDNRRLYQRSRAEVLAYLNRLSHLPVSPCIKLLRRSFVLEKGIFFTEGIVCEDVDHTYQVLLSAATFRCCPVPYYRARVGRSGSVMTDPSGAQKRFASTLFIVRKWLEKAQTQPEDSAVIYGFLSIQYVVLASMYRSLPAKVQAAGEQALSDLPWLLNHGGSRLFVVLRLLRALLGFRLFSLLAGFLF